MFSEKTQTALFLRKVNQAHIKQRQKGILINEKIIIEEKTSAYNEAYIETYFWQESEELYPGQRRPAIVICPGGAYGMTSDREAEGIAIRFMSMGYHTVVLRYSVAPARYPVALRQLAKTVALLRENSEKWHIEKDKILVAGFSAGGHLAASLGVFWNTPELKEITDPAEWHDSQLSCDHLRKIWT